MTKVVAIGLQKWTYILRKVLISFTRNLIKMKPRVSTKSDFSLAAFQEFLGIHLF